MQVGEIWDWKVINMSHGEHPFHVHGFPFELISYDFQDMMNPQNNFVFQPSAKRVLKDTIRIPPRLGAKGSSKTIATLRTHFSDANRPGGIVAHGETPTFDPSGNFVSGGWLAHCHLLEHSAAGMLTMFEVRDPNDPFHLLGHHVDGTNGKVSLTASGDVTMPLDPLTFEMVNGPPNSTGFLVFGNIAANRPILGGTVIPGLTVNGVNIVPKPFFLYRVVNFDANGRATYSSPLGNLAGSQTTYYTQLIVKDTGAVKNYAVSNGVSFFVP